MSFTQARSYSGADEKILLAQAQAEHPDGFEILSITQSGYLWWRKTIVLVRPLTCDAKQEMQKIRLISAIYARREMRHQQETQHNVLSHAHDFNQQQSR